MSDQELDNSNLTYMKKIEKYFDAGISIYSLKSTESEEDIKPSKKYSDNILDELKNDNDYKNQIIKRKMKKKIISNFSKTASKDYNNFLILNREKKFKTYFHDSDSKSKKPCFFKSEKEYERIKNAISIKHLDNKENFRNKIPESVIHKQIKLLNDQLFITNYEKQTKIFDILKNMNSRGDEEDNHQTENENSQLNQNSEKFDYNSVKIPQNSKIDAKSQFSKKKTFYSEFDPRSKCSLRSSEKNEEFYEISTVNEKGKFLKDNIDSVCEEFPKEKKSYTILNGCPNSKTYVEFGKHDYTWNYNNRFCTYDPDYFLLNPKNNKIIKKNSMNFNKNPGLVKRSNFRYSLKIDNIMDNFSSEDFENKINSNSKNKLSKHNFKKLYCSIEDKLPNITATHDKNNSGINSRKIDFVESFNKFTKEKDRRFLENKNNLFNSANDFDRKISVVKMIEKQEVLQRSPNKFGSFNEKIKNNFKKKSEIKFINSEKLEKFYNKQHSGNKENKDSNSYFLEEKEKETTKSNFEKNISPKIKNRIKENVKMDLYSLKKIKDLNLFEENNNSKVEQRLDNTYGLFYNLTDLKYKKKMKILNIPNKHFETFRNKISNNESTNVLINTSNFTIPRTMKNLNKISNLPNEEKKMYLIDIYDRKKL